MNFVLVSLLLVQSYKFKLVAPYQQNLEVTTYSNLKLKFFTDTPEELTRSFEELTGLLKIDEDKEIIQRVEWKIQVRAKLEPIFNPLRNIKEKLDLDKILHDIDLQKVVSRIPYSLFNIILSRTLRLLYSHGENILITAIDATGFTSFYVSHYCYR